jgi:hypothetical protein
MCLRETRWGDIDWIHVTQNREQQPALMNMVTDIRIP